MNRALTILVTHKFMMVLNLAFRTFLGSCHGELHLTKKNIKQMKRALIIILTLFLFVPAIDAQKNSCKKFHLYSYCNANPGPRFKYDGQSRSNIIGVGDQMIYSLVLYADRQYSINLCTSEYFKPVHIKLLNAETDEEMYDNQADDYLETITLNVDRTQRIKVFVEVLAEEMTEEEKLEYFGCLGMMIQYRKER